MSELWLRWVLVGRRTLPSLRSVMLVVMMVQMVQPLLLLLQPLLLQLQSSGFSRSKLFAVFVLLQFLPTRFCLANLLLTSLRFRSLLKKSKKQIYSELS